MPGSEQTTHFAKLDPHVPLEPIHEPAPRVEPQRTIRDPNELARDGWTHAKRLIKDADAQAVKGWHAAYQKPEEPILKSIRAGLGFVRKRWYGDGVPEMSVAHKVALVVILIFAASTLYKPIAGVAIQFLIIYGIYYAVWATIIRPGIMRHAGETPPTATAGEPAPGEPASAGGVHARINVQTALWPSTQQPLGSIAERTTQPKSRPRPRTNWRERANQHIAAKPLRQKLTELSGSMLLAAIFAAVAACAIPMLASNNQQSSEVFAAYLWLTVVGTLGSWAILVPSKFAEGKLEDQVPMRLTLMLLGAMVGLVAWAVADSLLLKMPKGHEPFDVGAGILSHKALQWPTMREDANPPLPIYIAYFAFLFLLPRWWRLTEFTRSTRLSLWCMMTSVFTAWIVHFFWWFPQPIGMIAAAVISLSTQLASPWMPPSRRREFSLEREGQRA